LGRSARQCIRLFQKATQIPKAGHPIKDHIIFRSFLEQQDLFAFGSFASLLSVLWVKTRKNNKKMPINFLGEI
jgi:hypothetical protein